MCSQQSYEKPAIPVVALLTDFGVKDGYVGAMKGVILSICPQARIIDLTHHIEPQNVHQAAFVLNNIYRYLPAQTIIVAVVDPGVGSSRKPIGIQTDRHIFIGPDNGIFSYITATCDHVEAFNLSNHHYHLRHVSSTFHGRDIFSPVAGYIASGTPLEKMGMAIHKFEKLHIPPIRIEDHKIHGEVIHIDHFGNLITNIGHLEWDADDMLHLTPVFPTEFLTDDDNLPKFGVEACSIHIKDRRIETMLLSYASTSPHSILSLINSGGNLEIAVNRGNAAEMLNAQIGDPVTLDFAP